MDLNERFVLDLGCYSKAARGERLGIYLHQTGSRFVRQYPNRLYYTRDARLWIGTKSTVYVQKRLSHTEKQRIRLELASRIYVRFRPNEIGDYFIRDKGMATYPEALWNPHDEYFLTMESVTSKGETQSVIYPRFIGIRGFDIRHRSGGHISSCLLVCGIFEDAQGNDRPCGVVYTDADPSTKVVFEAITANNGIANGGLLGNVRDFLISKHSPDGTTLCWNDVANRVARIAGDALAIHLEISLTDGASMSEGNRVSHDDRSDIEWTDIGEGGLDVASLPFDYSGEKQYLVSVHISRYRGEHRAKRVLF